MKKILIFAILITLGANAKTCSDFNSWKEAQVYYEAKKPGYRSMDRDHDGEACESMSHKAKKVYRHMLITYKDGKKDGYAKVYDSLELCENGIKNLLSIVKSRHISYKCMKK